MRDAGIAFHVVGALFALYVIAAAWRSKDAGYRGNDQRRATSRHAPTVERRVIHWWRARRRLRSIQT